MKSIKQCLETYRVALVALIEANECDEVTTEAQAKFDKAWDALSVEVTSQSQQRNRVLWFAFIATYQPFDWPDAQQFLGLDGVETSEHSTFVPFQYCLSLVTDIINALEID